jgi:hypothetical protein
MARNIEKRAKFETDTVGPGIDRENWKTSKMRHIHYRLKIWWETMKTDKRGKWETHMEGRGIDHCRTWNRSRKLKNVENEKYTL